MTQFTKKAIIDAFIELIDEHALDKITVKDIVTKCGINRNTFYYYYQDIYALVEDIFEQEAQKIIGNNDDFGSLQEACMKAVTFVRLNKHGIYHIYKSISREQLENYLNKVAYNNVLKFVSKEAQGTNADESDIELLSAFYAHAFVGMVLSWLNDGMKVDAIPYIERLGVLLNGNVKYIFSKDNKIQTNK